MFTRPLSRRHALGILLGGPVLSFVSGCGIGGPPSDDVMIWQFRHERPAFDGLVTMMADDRVVGELDFGAMPSGSPEGAARRERYRSLLQRTGCHTIYRAEDGRVTFDVWYLTSGGGVAGTGFKGFVYAPTPPKPLRPALDAGGLLRFEDTFRHIDGAWYLYRMYV